MSGNYRIRKIKTIVVDDNQVFLEGLVTFLKESEKYEVIARGSSGMKMINRPELNEADLLLMDIDMPDMNGFEVAIRINFLYPALKMVAITMYEDGIYLKQIVEAGFRGFINKERLNEELFTALKKVEMNEYIFPEGISITKKKNNE